MARVTTKHQVTIEKEAFVRAGIIVGDDLESTAVGPGKVLLERARDPIETFAGVLTDVYEQGPTLDDLRDEWD